MIYIILGAFFGDEGKGQCVNNKLCGLDNPIVVRFSGANQVGHNVRHNDLTHCFSNYGSGTLRGVPTYWSDKCVCDPTAAAFEGVSLISQGIVPKIYYSPRCQIVLPCDIVAQRLNSANRTHGTVGTGYKAVLDRVKAGFPVHLIDCLNPLILREKLNCIMKFYYTSESNAVGFNYDKWIEDVCTFANKIQFLSITDVLKNWNNVVFEGSQGILLDQSFGIMPHCTPSNTTSQNIWDIPHITHQTIKTFYVCRPYITRHGNGPFCTDTKIISVNDPNNQFGDFQGHFRACEFDINLLTHSLQVDNIYNKSKHKSIVISHADEISSDLLAKLKEFSKLNNLDELHGFEFETWRF